jgi:heat shock protein HslJ
VLTAASLDGVGIALGDRFRVTMTVEGAQVSGRAACNLYGASVSIENGSLSIGEVGRTLMACEPTVMEVESAFLDGLRRAAAALRSGDTLVLTGEGVVLEFAALPPVPTAELVGVTWVLDSIIEGETVSSAAAGSDPVTLRLESDRSFSGSTGCRQISGRYAVRGDTVVFVEMQADGECPEDLQWQDGHVVTVLGDGFTADIDGNRLTVMSMGGEGLAYTAES